VPGHRAMKRTRSLALIIVVLLPAGAPTARAQALNTPHVGYAYPAGGQRGTTVDVRIGGRFLDGTTSVVLSGRGLRARVAGFSKPLTPQELTSLREKAAELQKTARTPADARKLRTSGCGLATPCAGIRTSCSPRS